MKLGKKKLLMKKQRKIGTSQVNKLRRNNKLNKYIIELELKINKLKASHEKLRKYTRHSKKCNFHNLNWKPGSLQKYDCICGLEQALKETSECDKL